MARRNSGYWQGRMEALEDSQYQRSAAYYQDVQKQFRAADKDMQSDIEKWYQRLADNNDISYAGAKRLLKKNELEEFHWSVKQYIKAGEENAVDKRWMKQLENASARYHISYLEAMKLQTQQHAELLSAEFEDGITDFLHKSYGNQYYHAAFEIAKGTGAGANLAKLNTKTVDIIVKKPWAQDGKNFSDRIWTNKEKLVNSLHTELTQSIIRGADPKQAIKNLADTMAVGKAQAGRLVMTESAAIASAAQKDCLNDLGVEKYQILATLDDRTSQICQDLDGEVFDMKDYEVGVTAPPFHPNCRTTTVPYFNDEFTGGEERAARGEDGKISYVPADMKYGDWKKQYVDVERHSPDDENQKRYAVRREEWKAKHTRVAQAGADGFDKAAVKEEVKGLREKKGRYLEQMADLESEGKQLTQKVYFDLTGTKEEASRLEAVSGQKKAIQEQIKDADKQIVEKQGIYKAEAEKRILESGTLDEIKLSKEMAPEAVDKLEGTLYHLKEKYGIMPKGIVYDPIKVTDATASYNWMDDKIYLSNKLNDFEKYKETIQKSEESLAEYNKHYEIQKKAGARLEAAEKVLSDKSIKGYEREKALIEKTEAEIQLSTSRMAVRENPMDVVTHEYGHYIHRHAETDYVQKKNVFGMKELGGNFDGKDWKYDINKRYSAKAKVSASFISRRAAEDPYETFAEGFLALEKGEAIPRDIEKVITDAEKKAGVKSIEKIAKPDIMKPGAVSGALTDKNDPLYVKREKHAQSYYQAVRSSKKSVIIKTISDNTGLPEKYISKAYDHVFMNEYDLYGGSKRFDPDYDMSESFRRLREGRDIQDHDVVLLQHEHLEYGLMNKLGMPYDKAHRLAESKYNYREALDEFKKNRKL